MGRVRAEDIENLVKEIYISLELDNFQHFRESMDKLLSINLEDLTKSEAKTLYENISKIQERISKKQADIASKIKNNTDIKKYGNY